MAKLEGVKTLDMVNGEITKVEYNGEVYEKVETPKKGDIGLRISDDRPWASVGEFYPITHNGVSEAYKDDEGDEPLFKVGTFTYFRKPSAPSLEAWPKRTIAIAGDVVEMITDDDYGDFKNGSRFTVKEDSEVREYIIDNNGDKRYINEFDHLEYRIVEFAEEIDHETPELFAKVIRPNNVPIPGDYVEFRDDIAEDCSAFLTVGKKYEVERVDAFGGADITDDNGYFESAEPYETKAIYVKYTQEQAEKKAEIGDKILVVDAKETGGNYGNGDILTVRLNSSVGVFVEEFARGLRNEEFIVLNPEQVGEAVEEPEVEESQAEGVPFEVGQFVVSEDNNRYLLTIPEAGALEVVEVGDLVMGVDIRVKFNREFKGKNGKVAEVGESYPVNSDYFRLATDEEIVEALGLNEIKEGDRVEVLAENHPILSKGATFTVTDVGDNGVRVGSAFVAFVGYGKPRIKLVEEGEKQPEIKPGDYVINHRGTLGRVDEIRDGVHYLGEWLYKEEYPDKYPYGMSTFDAVKRLATPEEIAEYEAYKEKQDEQVTNPETIEEGDLVRVIDSPGALPDGSVFKVTRVDEDGTLYGTTEYETSTTQYIYEPKRVELVAKEVDVYV